MFTHSPQKRQTYLRSKHKSAQGRRFKQFDIPRNSFEKQSCLDLNLDNVHFDPNIRLGVTNDNFHRCASANNEKNENV
jgi:hypothetical protein